MFFPGFLSGVDLQYRSVCFSLFYTARKSILSLRFWQSAGYVSCVEIIVKTSQLFLVVFSELICETTAILITFVELTGQN